MQLQVGMIVRATAGKEKDRFYLVVKLDGQYVYLADGRRRTLEHPKRKSRKHIRMTTDCVRQTEMMTDAALRRTLRRYETLGSERICDRFHNDSV